MKQWKQRDYDVLESQMRPKDAYELGYEDAIHDLRVALKQLLPVTTKEELESGNYKLITEENLPVLIDELMKTINDGVDYPDDFDRGFTEGFNRREEQDLTLMELEYKEEKEREIWLTDEVLYPITIIQDRYSGTYSGGQFTAFPYEYWKIPKSGPDGSDQECMKFWNNFKGFVGLGADPESAVENLKENLKNNRRYGNE